MLDYLRTFWEQFNWGALTEALQRVLGVLLCLTVHETSHGLAAWALGDPTACRENRVSLNPLRHIDWLGLASMLLCGFGWAKSVPVDMRRFKNPRAGMAVTALAGPVSNLLLAMVLMLLTSLVVRFAPMKGFWMWLVPFLMSTALLSIGLGLFNLLPIPPLDGSKVLFSLLPEGAYLTLMRYERYGMIVLLLLVWLDVGGSYLSQAIYGVYLWMAGRFF